MNNVFFLTLVITAIILLVAGLILFLFPPKKINHLYGYRTSQSMESKEKWDFAQRYSAREMIKVGIVFALLSLIGLIFKPEGELANIAGSLIVVFTIIIAVARIEKALKKNA